MKSILKRVYIWTTVLFQTIVSLLSVLIFSRCFASRQMKKQSKIKRKNDAIVLGNGPSLKPIVSDKLKELMDIDADIVAVNFFCSSSYFSIIKPELYVIADPAYFQYSKEEWIERQKEKTIECLLKVDWKMQLYIPANAKGSPLSEKLLVNDYIDLCFYNLVPVTAFKCVERFLFKNNYGILLPETVLNCAIFLLINLNYKNIYLLGADHTWLKEVNVNEKNEVVMGYEHFYGDPNVVKLDSTLSEWLYTQYSCFKVHDRLREYADYMKVNVYNSTRGSFIDAYERKYVL